MQQPANQIYYYNLLKWYMDIFTYCNNQTNFIVVLVGL
jgi:hypothetical protein